MKGKITKEGYLVIDRINKQMTVKCPFREPIKPCGDWCPLFGEVLGKECHHKTLRICKDVDLVFEEFEDERKPGEKRDEA